MTRKKMMNKLLLHSSLFLVIGLTWLGLINPAKIKAASALVPQGRVIVEVAGIETAGGNVRISLVNTRKSFSENIETNYYQALEVPVGDLGKISVVFDVPHGNYAVKLYHDENNNRKLDKFPVFGIPLEPYGFSNNPRSFFGPPSFEEASFTVEGGEIMVPIKLR